MTNGSRFLDGRRFLSDRRIRNAPWRRRLSCVILLGLGLLADSQIRSALGAVISGPRRPIRLVAWAGRVWVANQRSGSLSWLRESSAHVEGEQAIGQQLIDLQPVEFADRLAVLDSAAAELIVLRTANRQLAVTARQAVPLGATSLVVCERERELIVGSSWARQLTWWSGANDGTLEPLQRVGSLDLPFAPGRLLLSRDGNWLFVADAFGPYVATVDCGTRQLVGIVQIPGHNLRGLSLTRDGTQLQIVHQMLNDFIPTSRDHVFWGNVLSNLLRTLPLTDLVEHRGVTRATAPKIHGTLEPLGRESHAAGDPTCVAMTPRGDLLVALAGTGELAVRGPNDRSFQRFPVGPGASDLVVLSGGTTALVANRFADQLARVDLNERRVVQVIDLGDPAAATLADRGEQLFYDATLSLHGWFSCHSCHTDGHTCGLLNDNLGDNSFGAPKRIPSLLGTGATSPWGWNGSQTMLIDQIHKSMKLTMRAEEQRPADRADAAALAAYLQTLPPPPSLATARRIEPSPAVAPGRQLFHQLDCVQCHRPPEYTTRDVYDVGLSDERGNTTFNPPSLRGLSHRHHFFHDNRCGSLPEVLRVHPSPHGTQLSSADEADLIEFLESL